MKYYTGDALMDAVVEPDEQAPPLLAERGIGEILAGFSSPPQPSRSMNYGLKSMTGSPEAVVSRESEHDD